MARKGNGAARGKAKRAKARQRVPAAVVPELVEEVQEGGADENEVRGAAEEAEGLRAAGSGPGANERDEPPIREQQREDPPQELLPKAKGRVGRRRKEAQRQQQNPIPPQEAASRLRSPSSPEVEELLSESDGSGSGNEAQRKRHAPHRHWGRQGPPAGRQQQQGEPSDVSRLQEITAAVRRGMELVAEAESLAVEVRQAVFHLGQTASLIKQGEKGERSVGGLSWGVALRNYAWARSTVEMLRTSAASSLQHLREWGMIDSLSAEAHSCFDRLLMQPIEELESEPQAQGVTVGRGAPEQLSRGPAVEGPSVSSPPPRAARAAEVAEGSQALGQAGNAMGTVPAAAPPHPETSLKSPVARPDIVPEVVEPKEVKGVNKGLMLPMAVIQGVLPYRSEGLLRHDRGTGWLELNEGVLAGLGLEPDRWVRALGLGLSRDAGMNLWFRNLCEEHHTPGGVGLPYQVFRSEFELAHGNTLGDRSEAHIELSTVRQLRTESVETFAGRWLRLWTQAHPERASWCRTTRGLSFYTGLLPYYKSELSRVQPPPVTYEEFRRAVLVLESTARRDALRALETDTSNPFLVGPLQPPVALGPPGSLAAGLPLGSAYRATSAPPGGPHFRQSLGRASPASGCNALEVHQDTRGGSGSQRGGRERGDRRDRGGRSRGPPYDSSGSRPLCFQCGSPDHFRASCPSRGGGSQPSGVMGGSVPLGNGGLRGAGRSTAE